MQLWNILTLCLFLSLIWIVTCVLNHYKKMLNYQHNFTNERNFLDKIEFTNIF